MKELFGCTAVKLTAREGTPYWFRTCDIGGEIWRDGAHAVSFPAGACLELTDRAPLTARHAVLGLSYNAFDTWLLDGVNDKGLVGGLLALYEATSAAEARDGEEGVMGMEALTYLLATCATVEEVITAAATMRVLNVPAGEGKYSTSAMHLMLLDPSGRCVILEAADPADAGKLTVYENNLGLMTNSPPYPQQLENLSWFLSQSPEWNWGQEQTPPLTLNGMRVEGRSDATHFSLSGTLPASYASCDRFVRMALLTYLNGEGGDFSEETMLAQGSNLMSAVTEPNNRGLFHYTRFDLERGPQGGHESYTQYLVMYVPRERALYVKPYDSTAWTRLCLSDCSRERTETHAVCHAPMGGVREEADC